MPKSKIRSKSRSKRRSRKSPRSKRRSRKSPRSKRRSCKSSRSSKRRSRKSQSSKRRSSIKTFSGKRKLNNHPKRTSPIRISPENVDYFLAEKLRSKSREKFPSLRNSKRLIAELSVQHPPSGGGISPQLPKSLAEVSRSRIGFVANSGKSYSIGSQISSNGESIAYEGQDDTTKGKVFIKSMKNTVGGMGKFIPLHQLEMLKEITNNLGVQFNNEFVPLLDYMVSPNIIYLVYKWNPGIPLFQLDQKLKVQWTSEIYEQIYNQLEVLHNFGVVHGRIAPKNILVFENNGKPIATLTDLGKSCLTKESSSMLQCRNVDQASGLLDALNYHIPPSAKADHLALALTIASILDPKIKETEIPEMIEAISKAGKADLPKLREGFDKAIKESVADASLINRIYSDVESFFETDK